MAATQPATTEPGNEQEEYIDQNDVLAEVNDDPDGDHPMDEDDDEPGEEEQGQDEVVWEDNSIQQFTAHGGSSEESKSVFAVATHPTEPLAVSGGEDDLGYIWDLNTGEVVVKLTGHTDSVAAVGFNADGQMVATGGMDGHVRLWRHVAKSGNWRTWEFLTDVQGPDEVVLTPADARFGMDGGITALGVNSASTVAVVGGADGAVRVVNLTKGDVIGALESHAEGESVECIAFVSPAATGTGTTDLELVVTAATDGKIFVSDLNTRRLRTTLLGHEDAVTSLTVHDDGRLITSSSSDKTLRTWDVRTGECIRVHQGHAGPVMGAAVGKRTGGEEVIVSAGDEGVCLVFPTR
ncbi:hypothetical protein FRC06_002271 [Ceratobasidium sp. 370]|nr:hypothetical protein FRC06_002271 [Ceratobasidium sp. 370]